MKHEKEKQRKHFILFNTIPQVLRKPQPLNMTLLKTQFMTNTTKSFDLLCHCWQQYHMCTNTTICCYDKNKYRTAKT